MFSHIFKLIWKKKKSNFLMMLEIFISFLILFAVWSLSVYTWRNYVKPIGFNGDNVWVMYLSLNTENDTLRSEYKTLVDQRLRGIKEIESFSFVSSNLPYGFSTSNNGFEYNGKEVMGDFLHVDPSYPATLGIPLTSGRWFTFDDTIGPVEPVVINTHMAHALFGDEDPLGKVMGKDEHQRRVVGTIDFFRHKSSFQADESCVFAPSGRWETDLLLKMRPEADAEFEAKLVADIQQLGKDWTIEIQHLDKMKATQDNIIIIPILILFIVCCFLVFNVGLGLFGVLFQNISRRKGEIGLRRAIGATKRQILTYFIGETLLVAGLGVVLGAFFAIQLPLLNVLDVEAAVYLWGMVLAMLSVAVIVVISAFYPSKQASDIYPAVALHEE